MQTTPIKGLQKYELPICALAISIGHQSPFNLGLIEVLIEDFELMFCNFHWTPITIQLSVRQFNIIIEVAHSNRWISLCIEYDFLVVILCLHLAKFQHCDWIYDKMA